MRMLMEMLMVQEGMEESSIDFPQPDLCPQVWDKQDGTYILKPEVEKKIYELLAEYPHLKLLDLAEEIHIIGSIGTNQYTEDADIDIHLVIPQNNLPQGKSLEDIQKDIKKWFKDNINTIGGYIGKHPIEVYYQLTPNQEYLADSLYDLTHHKWLKGPMLTKVDFNPYSRFKEIVDQVGQVVGETDDLLAELKRDTIDYDVVKQAIERAPDDVRSQLQALLRQKLAEIEASITELMANKKEWAELRKASSQPISPEQAFNDIELVKKWEDTNALFKFIARYQYLELITQLEHMMDDKQVDDAEVERIRALLGVVK